MKVGFIGLGRMGRGMASNLLKAGIDLTVYDAVPEAVSALADGGAKVANSVSEIAGQVDVLFTSLPGPAEVEAVVLGPVGVVQHMKPGLVLFELSTSSRSLAIRIEEAMRARGGHMLDAPVSGGPAGAESGDLAFWVGGEKALFDQHAALLAAMGDKACYVGPLGGGTVTKLVNNLLGQMVLASMAEVFSMGVKAGVDPLDLWEALRLGVTGKQSILFMLTQQFLPGKYDPPAMALKLGEKDVALATGLARELGVPMRLADVTLEKIREAMERGYQDRDTRVHMELQLESAGVEIAVDTERLKEAIARARGRA